ncbi:hypothetical protein BST61_g1582 [Cercospora zeina]
MVNFRSLVAAAAVAASFSSVSGLPTSSFTHPAHGDAAHTSDQSLDSPSPKPLEPFVPHDAVSVVPSTDNIHVRRGIAPKIFEMFVNIVIGIVSNPKTYEDAHNKAMISMPLHGNGTSLSSSNSTLPQPKELKESDYARILRELLFNVTVLVVPETDGHIRKRELEDDSILSAVLSPIISIIPRIGKAKISPPLEPLRNGTSGVEPPPLHGDSSSLSSSNSTLPPPKQPKDINYASIISDIINEYARGDSQRELGTYPEYLNPLFDQLKHDGYANGTGRGNLTTEGFQARKKKYDALVRSLLDQTIFYLPNDWVEPIDMLLTAMVKDGVSTMVQGKNPKPSLNKSRLPPTTKKVRPNYTGDVEKIVQEARKYDYRFNETMASFTPLLEELKKDGYMRSNSSIEGARGDMTTLPIHELVKSQTGRKVPSSHAISTLVSYGPG